jgi:hypothetical protein
MSPTTKRRKRETVAVPVRMTPREREALRECLFAEGFPSMSAWFRQQAIQKVRQSQPTPAELASC